MVHLKVGFQVIGLEVNADKVAMVNATSVAQRLGPPETESARGLLFLEEQLGRYRTNTLNSLA